MRADQDIRRDVERQLEWEPSIDAGEIGVAVKDGIVMLSASPTRSSRNSMRSAPQSAWPVSSAWPTMLRFGRAISVPTAKSLMQLSRR